MVDIKKRGANMSHSFLVRPDIKFETQQADESVVLVVRKHLVTQLSWILNSIFLIILGIIFSFFILPQFLAPNYIVVFTIFIFVFTFSYFWLNFLFWYFTVGIITTERVLDLDFISILYKEFTASTIDQISDISTKVGGFAGSIFNYGDVLVKTEGFQQNIEFDDVPMPAEVVKILNDLMRNFDNS